MLSKILLAVALPAVALAASCGRDEYSSPNLGRCLPKKGANAYCNVVQKCTEGFSCVSDRDGSSCQADRCTDAGCDLTKVAKVIRDTYFAAVHSGSLDELYAGWHPDAHLRSSWPCCAFTGSCGADGSGIDTWCQPDWDKAAFGNVVATDPPCVDYMDNGKDEGNGLNSHEQPTKSVSFTCVAPDQFLSIQQISESTIMAKALIAAEGYYYTDMLTLGLMDDNQWWIITKSTTSQGPTVESPFWMEGGGAAGSAQTYTEIANVCASYITAMHNGDGAAIAEMFSIPNKSVTNAADGGMYSVQNGKLVVQLASALAASVTRNGKDVSSKAVKYDKIYEISKNTGRGAIATVQYYYPPMDVVVNENLSVYNYGRQMQANNWKIMSVTSGKAIDAKAQGHDYTKVYFGPQWR